MANVGVVLSLVLVAGLAGVAHGAEWGTIVPAQSTIESVRGRYGEPTKRSTLKVEGYDTTEWVYEGDRAPRGLRRLVVSFGFLTPQGFRPDLVRTFRLYPLPGMFTQRSIVVGWGEPSGVGREGGDPALFYMQGLIVVFEADGWKVKEMIFTPPQPAAR
jgi:hypothetical protein